MKSALDAHRKGREKRVEMGVVVGDRKFTKGTLTHHVVWWQHEVETRKVGKSATFIHRVNLLRHTLMCANRNFSGGRGPQAAPPKNQPQGETVAEKAPKSKPPAHVV